MDLFVVEVGARGYCSTSLSFCLKQLGFSNKSCNALSKSLSSLAIQTSFAIWLARDCHEWESPSSITPLSQTVLTEATKHSKPSKKLTKAPLPKRYDRLGFINKGNTCYANSILQALSVLPTVSFQANSEGTVACPLVQSFCLNMTLLKRSQTAIDPSNFLRALENSMKESYPNFTFNQPQDAAEVLVNVVGALASCSHVLSHLFAIRVKSIISCDFCDCSAVEENILNVLDIPVDTKTSSALATRLNREAISQRCPICERLTPSTKEFQIISCGSVVIFQLERFRHHEGKFFRNSTTIDCMDDLTIPITQSLDDSMVVSFKNNYSLVATINHSGSWTSGHYTAFIKDPSSKG